MRLSADKRRALAKLASAGHDGVTQSLLTMHGVHPSLVAELVGRPLATATQEKVRAAGRGRDDQDHRGGARRSHSGGLDRIARSPRFPLFAGASGTGRPHMPTGMVGRKSRAAWFLGGSLVQFLDPQNLS
jgi:hypothetical protein